MFSLTAALHAAPLPEGEGARAQALYKQIRCVVCTAESIAESPALLAEDMRTFVRTGIDAGQTDEQILAQLQERYGDKVLMTPPVRSDTWLLWLAPLLFLAAGLAFWPKRKD